MASPKGFERLEFVKFSPAPKGDCVYDDYKEAFVLENPQVSVATSQGDGSGANLAPLEFQFKMGHVDAATFVKLCRDNDKSVTSLKYTSTQVYNKKREKKADVEYKGLTIKNATTIPIAGEDSTMVMLSIEYNEAKGKLTQYKPDGKVDKSFSIDIDLVKGKFYGRDLVAIPLRAKAMAEPSSKQRLRPSLLDRLTDLHPERQRETTDDVSVTEAQLREQVRRDLGWLFNTIQLAAGTDLTPYPQVQSSILNYGIVDLSGQMLSSVKPEQLEKSVRAALLRYEPRLLPESLEISAELGKNPFGMAALVVEVKAELYSDPLPLALHVRTEIDVETGRVTIGDAHEGR